MEGFGLRNLWQSGRLIIRAIEPEMIQDCIKARWVQAYMTKCNIREQNHAGCHGILLVWIHRTGQSRSTLQIIQALMQGYLGPIGRGSEIARTNPTLPEWQRFYPTSPGKMTNEPNPARMASNSGRDPHRKQDDKANGHALGGSLPHENGGPRAWLLRSGVRFSGRCASIVGTRRTMVPATFPPRVAADPVLKTGRQAP
jgi:hypothetical protein